MQVKSLEVMRDRVSSEMIVDVCSWRMSAKSKTKRSLGFTSKWLEYKRHLRIRRSISSCLELTRRNFRGCDSEIWTWRGLKCDNSRMRC